jgi:hypothetical protein
MDRKNFQDVAHSFNAAIFNWLEGLEEEGFTKGQRRKAAFIVQDCTASTFTSMMRENRAIVQGRQYNKFHAEYRELIYIIETGSFTEATTW